MEKDAALNMTHWDMAWPVLAGGALGLGARLGRWGYDLKNKDKSQAPAPISQIEKAQIEVPVEVSEEEAKELRREGITVKAAASTVIDTGLQGIAGSLAAIGGWSVLDNYLDSQRKEKARKELDRTRGRVENLIAGMPDEADYGMSRALKTACALYDQVMDTDDKMLKTALLDSIGGAVGSGTMNALLHGLKPLGIPLGIGATVAATRAFNSGRSRNKYRQRSKAIRDYVDGLGERDPMAVLVPVEKKKRKEKKPSQSFEPKIAAEDDDGMSDWIWLALAGAAGAAGYYWIAQNPEATKQYLPEWAHDSVNWMAGSLGNEAGVIPQAVRQRGAEITAAAADAGEPSAYVAEQTKALAAEFQENYGYELSPEEAQQYAAVIKQTDGFRSELYGQSATQLIQRGATDLGVEPGLIQAEYDKFVQAYPDNRNQAELEFREFMTNEYQARGIQAVMQQQSQDPSTPFARHLAARQQPADPKAKPVEAQPGAEPTPPVTTTPDPVATSTATEIATGDAGGTPGPLGPVQQQANPFDLDFSVPGLGIGEATSQVQVPYRMPEPVKPPLTTPAPVTPTTAPAS